MTKFKKSDLKHHLQNSIHVLKKSLDYATYCYFILAMLFFYHVGEMPSLYSYRLNIPRIIASSAIPFRVTTTNSQRRKRTLQDELSDAFSELENASPLLRNVLLPSILSTSLSDTDLTTYHQLLDQLQQQTGIFSNPQNFSQAYDYWISQLAKLTVKQGLSFYTPRSVIRLMVEIMKPSSGMSIYDPSVGTGGMFTESVRYIRQSNGDIDSVDFYGCELAADIWAICRMNMLVHGLNHAVINNIDALKNPPELLGKFDLVLQNMPLPSDTSLKGEIRRINDDFLTHVIEVMAINGRGAILTPATLLQEDHRNFWRHVINRDWLESVISLPAKLLHGTNSAAYVLVFNKNKPDARLGNVLFIRALNEALPYTRHNELEDITIHSAIQAFENWENIVDYSQVVPITKIEEHDYKLSVDKYLRLEEAVQPFDMTSALDHYRTAVKEREIAVDKLMKNLESLNDIFKPSDNNDRNA
jgi:type I restriction enzyme M protein